MNRCSVKKILFIISFLFALNVFASDYYTDKLGVNEIKFPIPNGYTEICKTNPQVKEYFNKMSGLENDLLGCLVNLEDLKLVQAGTKQNLSDYFLIIVPKKLKSYSIKPEVFKKFKDQYKKELTLAADKMDSYNEDLDKTLNSVNSKQKAKIENIGNYIILEDTDKTLGIYMPMSFYMGGSSFHISMSSMVFNLKDRVVISNFYLDEITPKAKKRVISLSTNWGSEFKSLNR